MTCQNRDEKTNVLSPLFLPLNQKGWGASLKERNRFASPLHRAYRLRRSFESGISFAFRFLFIGLWASPIVWSQLSPIFFPKEFFFKSHIYLHIGTFWMYKWTYGCINSFFFSKLYNCKFSSEKNFLFLFYVINTPRHVHSWNLSLEENIFFIKS